MKGVCCISIFLNSIAFSLICSFSAPSLKGQSAFAGSDSNQLAQTLKQWVGRPAEERELPGLLKLEEKAQWAAENGWGQLYAAFNLELGTYYRDMAQVESARHFFKQHYDWAVSRGDSLGIALSLAQLGNTYMSQGDQKNALEYNKAALGIRLRNNEEPVKIANSFMFTGVSLMRLGQLDQAEKMFDASMHIRTTQTDSLGFALLSRNMGSLALFQGNLELAQERFLQALNFRQESKSLRARGSYFLSLADAYHEANQPEKALFYVEKARGLLDSANYTRGSAEARFLLGKIHFARGDHKIGEENMLKAAALVLQRGILSRGSEIYGQLCQEAEKRGLHQAALTYYRMQDLLYDSLLALQKDRSLSHLLEEQELNRKNRAIERLNREKEQRTFQRNLLLAGLFIALLLVCIVYYFNRARKLAYRQMRAQKQEAEALLKEKVQLLDDLKKTQERLVQQEKMAALGQLTAGIAHELNNPLNFILNNAAALELDHQERKTYLPSDHSALQALDEEIQILIADIRRGAARMRQIVQELGVFSRAEHENMSPLTLEVVIEEALRMVQVGTGKKWKVEQRFPAESTTILGVYGRLVQVFSNLFNNAFYALERRFGAENAQDGMICIEIKRLSQIVEIRLSDNGSGMSEAEKRRVFDPFYTTKPVGEGTGLGLSIVFALVKAHQGNIEVESKQGAGTTFILGFPSASLTLPA